MTSSCLRVILSVTELAEYCEDEYFKPSCDQNEAVVMHTALYGRMRQGKCSAEKTAPCSTNVLGMLDAWCSGRPSCDREVSDLNKELSPCPKDYRSYLEAGNHCVPGRSDGFTPWKQISLHQGLQFYFTDNLNWIILLKKPAMKAINDLKMNKTTFHVCWVLPIDIMTILYELCYLIPSCTRKKAWGMLPYSPECHRVSTRVYFAFSRIRNWMWIVRQSMVNQGSTWPKDQPHLAGLCNRSPQP